MRLILRGKKLKRKENMRMEWMLREKKPNMVGKRAVERNLQSESKKLMITNNLSSSALSTFFDTTDATNKIRKKKNFHPSLKNAKKVSPKTVFWASRRGAGEPKPPKGENEEQKSIN